MESGHVYLRWYRSNQPNGQPQRMENEASAKAEVLTRFPAATFGRRVSTSGQPSALLVGVDGVSYAYDGPAETRKSLITEILYPTAGSHLA